MNEFYQRANALLKIKRNNPVVTKVQREDEMGDTQVFEEKTAVDSEIAKYFTEFTGDRSTGESNTGTSTLMLMRMRDESRH